MADYSMEYIKSGKGLPPLKEHLLSEIAELKKSPWYNNFTTREELRARVEAIEIIEDLCIKNNPVIERPKGKWIFTKTVFDKYGYTVECSSCHKKWKTYDEIRWKKENKFCPNCGTEMREVE